MNIEQNKLFKLTSPNFCSISSMCFSYFSASDFDQVLYLEFTKCLLSFKRRNRSFIGMTHFSRIIKQNFIKYLRRFGALLIWVSQQMLNILIHRLIRAIIFLVESKFLKSLNPMDVYIVYSKKVNE